ncbi:hypothetical protein TURU_143842 [Turdus rufiventris]|nr:hypothetical protein TURU_143842 [Turdus rufiventris]
MPAVKTVYLASLKEQVTTQICEETTRFMVCMSEELKKLKYVHEIKQKRMGVQVASSGIGIETSVFSVYVGDKDSGMEDSLSKFPGNTWLSGAVDKLEGRDAIQRDLDSLENRVC